MNIHILTDVHDKCKYFIKVHIYLYLKNEIIRNLTAIITHALSYITVKNMNDYASLLINLIADSHYFLKN